MNVIHYMSEGRFNLLSDETQWQVVLVTPAGSASELFNEKPEHEPDMTPSEVLDLLDQRRCSYFWSSNGEQKKSRLLAIKERINEFDVSWCEARAALFEKRAMELRERAQSIRDEMEG